MKPKLYQNSECYLKSALVPTSRFTVRHLKAFPNIRGTKVQCPYITKMGKTHMVNQVTTVNISQNETSMSTIREFLAQGLIGRCMDVTKASEY